MARTKKRRKQYNPNDRMDKLIQKVLKHSAVIYVLNDKPFANLIDMNNGKIINVSPEIERAIKEREYKWSVLLVVFCVDQHGEHYMRMQIGDTNVHCKQSDLDTAASKQHVELLHTCNEHHMIGIGWMASPYFREFDKSEDEFIESIFDKFGAWIPADSVQELKTSRHI